MPKNFTVTLLQKLKITQASVGIAGHGEWLILFTVKMMPYADFDFVNINLKEDYRPYYSANNGRDFPLNALD